MTPEQHNKYLGIAHLVYGSIFFLLLLGMLAFFTFLMMLSTPHAPDAPPIAFFAFMWIFFGVFYGAMMIPSFVAGYGLLKRKSWAKTAAIIAGVVAGMSFPLGTAVCIYTFWFLFSDPGKFLYDRKAYALPPPPPRFGPDPAANRREPQYVPPSSPPDWR